MVLKDVNHINQPSNLGHASQVMFLKNPEIHISILICYPRDIVVSSYVLKESLNRLEEKENVSICNTKPNSEVSYKR